MKDRQNTRIIIPLVLGVIVFICLNIADMTGMSPLTTTLLLLSGALTCVFCFAFIRLRSYTKSPVKLIFQTEPLLDATHSLCETLKQMGFEPIGSQYTVEGSDNIQISFLHSTDNTYAHVAQCFHFKYPPFCTFVSVFRNNNGSLVSLDHSKRQPLFIKQNHFIQIFEGITPQRLYEKHSESLAFLTDQGILLDRTLTTDFFMNLEKDLESRRVYVRHRLVLAAIKLLCDILSPSGIYKRSIVEQRDTPKKIAYLRSLYSKSESLSTH